MRVAPPSALGAWPPRAILDPDAMRRRSQSTTALTVLMTLAASLLIHLVLWPIGDRLLSLQWQVRRSR